MVAAGHEMEGLRVLVLYVTVEQENAIIALFDDHKWRLENKADVLCTSLQNGQTLAQSPELGTLTKLLEKTFTSAPSDNSDYVQPVITDCVSSDNESAQNDDTVVHNQPEITETLTRQTPQQLNSGVITRQTRSKEKGVKSESTCKKVDSKARRRHEKAKSPLPNNHVNEAKQSRKREIIPRQTKRKLKTDDVNQIDNAKDLQSKTGKAGKALNNKQEKFIQSKRCILQQPVADNEASQTKRQEETDNDPNSPKTTDCSSKSQEKTSQGILPFVCKLCDFTSDYKKYLRHMHTVHKNESFPCRYCSKTFKCGYRARTHERWAHENIMKCKACNKVFTSQCGFLNHNKLAHQNKPNYKCDKCEATFLYKDHYEGHMNKHAAQKPFSCTRCDAKFRYKTSITLHLAKCDGSRRHSETHNSDGSLATQKILCDLCGATLKSKDSLRTHHQHVHTEVPKSECPTCGKMFKTPFSLRRHERVAHMTTDGFPCEICGRCFKQASVLREHLKRHKKEFSMYCKTCDKGFYSKFKLQEHERFHTGEKPFRCPICTSFSSASKNNLNKHMQRHEIGTTRGSIPRRKNSATKASSSKKKKSRVTVSGDKSKLPLLKEGKSEGDTSVELLHKNSGHDYAQVVVDNSDVMDFQDLSGNHGNVVVMTMSNDIERYNYEQDGQGSVILIKEEHNDPRMLSTDCHGNTNINESSDHGSQGLNILTVAMNIVN